MANKVIHLWDNSWHVQDPTGGQTDSFGRKPIGLNDCCDSSSIKAENIRPLSQISIGKLMEDESCDVLVWPNSFNGGYEELKDQTVFRITEEDGKTIDSITTNNVVGFIGVGSGHNKYDIRIHSRFSSTKRNNKNVVDDYFLYYMLEKAMGIHVNMPSFKTSADSKESIIDLLFLFFPRLLKEALSQGMYKKYVYHEYNDANIRGVVDVNRHIRLNIPANGKIAYRTREFCYDNNVTQLIRHTIEFIRRKPFGKAILHNDPDTEGCVQQIIQATPTFVPQKRQAVINDNLRPVSHPYYTKYTALQKLCLRILRHEKLSYGTANDNKIHGLLIDAAWLWEEYVAKVLSENGLGLKHYTRKNSPFYLFSDSNGSFQQIIPDYYDEDNNIVADAKYIPLHRSRKLDAERAAPIYYKTIMYMYRFDVSKGFLFHPCSKSDIEEMEKTNEDVIEKYKDGNVVVTTYNIEERNGCTLRKVGIVIPKDESVIDKYVTFREKMNTIENAFSEKMSFFL